MAEEPPATADPDDTPPTGDEAKAQSRQTIMPLIWMALGALVILLFLVFAMQRGPGDSSLHDSPAASANPGPPAGH
jgi:hypothetical protein